MLAALLVAAILIVIFAESAAASTSDNVDLTASVDTGTGSDLGTIIGSGNKAQDLAKAIATAEGFYGTPGDIPQRAHNPGDLELGDIGYGVIQGKTVYPSDQAGWNALTRMVSNWLAGTDSLYTLDMTFNDVAVKYTGNDNPDSWAQNLVATLNGMGYAVTTENTLGDYVAA